MLNGIKHLNGDRTPYTYLVGWSKLNKWYYGSRYGKDCHPNDLWVSYFTSSKVVKQFVIDNGDPDVIQVRKVFSNAKLCKTFEDGVLKRIKLRLKGSWNVFMLNIRSDSFKGIDISKVKHKRGKDNPMHSYLADDNNRKLHAQRTSEGTKRGQANSQKALTARILNNVRLRTCSINRFNDPKVVQKAMKSRKESGLHKIEVRPIVLTWLGVSWIFVTSQEATTFCTLHKIPKWTMFKAKDGIAKDRTTRILRMDKIITNEKELKTISKLDIWVRYTESF